MTVNDNTFDNRVKQSGEETGQKVSISDDTRLTYKCMAVNDK